MFRLKVKWDYSTRKTSVVKFILFLWSGSCLCVRCFDLSSLGWIGCHSFVLIRDVHHSGHGLERSLCTSGSCPSVLSSQFDMVIGNHTNFAITSLRKVKMEVILWVGGMKWRYHSIAVIHRQQRSFISVHAFLWKIKILIQDWLTWQRRHAMIWYND